MKENGSINRKKAMEQKFFLMDACTKGSTLMERQEELVLMYGQMESAMMASGSTVSNMVLGCGEVKKVTAIKGNGNLVSLKVMACILGQMVTTTKDSSKNVLSMEKEYKDLQMETCTKEDILMANLQVMENTTGSMEVILKVIL
jgi:hypothetical protein